MNSLTKPLPALLLLLLLVVPVDGVHAGVRSLAFSYSNSCTEHNMHSVQASSFAEAAGVAAQWLQSPDFIWSTQQLQLPQLKRR